jgi:hypothetical protein
VWVDGNGGAVLNERNRRVILVKPPTSAAEVQSLIGAWTQNRRWIPMFSSVAPLTDLTRKGFSWQWEVKEQNAFDGVNALFSSRLLSTNRTVIRLTDASDFGAGSNLLQRIGGEVFKIGFFSRKFSPVERGMLMWRV